MTTYLSEDKSFLSLGEAARQLGVSSPTLRRWADQGAITHIVTPGGHRRFAASDIERFLSESRRGVSAARLEVRWAEMALKNARAEIVSSQGEPWLEAFDRKDREHKRLLGRKLLALMLQYVSLDEEGEDILEEARFIGWAHAENALEQGLPLTVAIQAMMFFRDTLVEVAVDLPSTLYARPQVSRRLLRRINTLLNVVQLAVVEVYEKEDR